MSCKKESSEEGGKKSRSLKWKRSWSCLGHYIEGRREGRKDGYDDEIPCVWLVKKALIWIGCHLLLRRKRNQRHYLTRKRQWDEIIQTIGIGEGGGGVVSWIDPGVRPDWSWEIFIHLFDWIIWKNYHWFCAYYLGLSSLPDYLVVFIYRFIQIIECSRCGCSLKRQGKRQ